MTILISSYIIFFIRREGACCPVDSQPLKSESDLFRDLYTSREISQQRTICAYRQFGCLMELSPVDMETHINQCTYKNFSTSEGTQCPFKDVGCMEVFCSEESSHIHLEKNINSHLTVSKVICNLLLY